MPDQVSIFSCRQGSHRGSRRGQRVWAGRKHDTVAAHGCVKSEGSSKVEATMDNPSSATPRSRRNSLPADRRLDRCARDDNSARFVVRGGTDLRGGQSAARRNSNSETQAVLLERTDGEALSRPSLISSAPVWSARTSSSSSNPGAAQSLLDRLARIGATYLGWLRVGPWPAAACSRGETRGNRRARRQASLRLQQRGVCGGPRPWSRR